jgi:hypothetical protein
LVAGYLVSSAMNQEASTMFTRIAHLLIAFVLSTATFGCATTGGASTGAAVGTEEGKALIGALASKLGINQSYVSTALSTAQGQLGGGPKTAEAKSSAAQQGVDKVAAQAQTDGKALTDEQKTGLLDGIKELL